ncbi:ion channel [Solimicrobium silvestre]|uniref:Inward rectifier potassium channel n=1 Tax=Solimicrobium silvestre TaxID=2099400 RepID=A0A2S9GV73_9BURK|nr:ion channel [Solimicrobium silvestre]PRC91619.1 Inward rectifier potassium channel [Solimicrobium silvestre]
MHKSAKSRTTHPFKIEDRLFVAHGLSSQFWQDIYHYAMTSSWPVFFGAFSLMFGSMNVFFACLYMLGDHPIGNLFPNGFWGAFFFSVETLATVGYGDMHPQTVYGHLVSTIEIFIGMSGLAMVTGVIFARFSLPKSKILFTKHPVSHMHDNRYMLSIRIANTRLNIISEASAKLRMMRLETTAENTKFLRLIDLPLQRSQHPLFTLGWNLFHEINEDSPFFNLSSEEMERDQVRLILSLEGIDDTTSQAIRAHHIYSHDKIRLHHRYVDIHYQDADLVSHVDYARFHEIVPMPQAAEKN